MHLVVDAAVTHLDFEGALVAPGVVPGIDAEPVVLTVLGTPADGLDSVAAEGVASLVLVDTGLVGEEVLVDSKGTGDRSVLLDISLDSSDSGEPVAGQREMLIAAVGKGS